VAGFKGRVLAAAALTIVLITWGGGGVIKRHRQVL
jgi:hypothetical protein